MPIGIQRKSNIINLLSVTPTPAIGVTTFELACLTCYFNTNIFLISTQKTANNNSSSSSSHSVTDRHWNSQQTRLLTAACLTQATATRTSGCLHSALPAATAFNNSTEQKYIKHHWHWREQSLSCDAVSFSEWSPTFRSIALLSPSRVKHSSKSRHSSWIA
jgi:hypothetical protein